ncbi:MAG: Kazal-type serine protease inhibitor [Candidatus Competibacteraceae bacterium]|jgi:hypothetical protein|nr:Kazal-type serine protease inhibitor [Candidatus Competibacteraceae bacterium]
MSMNHTTKGIIGLVCGTVSLLSGADLATAASDYKVIREKTVMVGEWKDHQPGYLIRFYMPSDYDSSYKTVLQMNISSTNKSSYNSLYLNPEFVPGEFEGCDSIHQDRNENYRIGSLPYVEHERWAVHHEVVEGKYLKPGDNYLLVCARNHHGDTWGDLDNFYLKDIVLHYREYEPAPEFCPAVFEPVCGADGMTYNNACEADQTRVEIVYEGSCSVE